MRLEAAVLETLCDGAGIRAGTRLRQAVLLRYSEGRCAAEIAVELGVEQSTVRVMLHRAQPRLRTALQASASEETLHQEILALIVQEWADARDPELLSLREEAQALLVAYRGHRGQPKSLSGEPLRAPLVGVEDFVKVARERRKGAN